MTSGDWLPGRLREARSALRDHGRPVSQDRFAAMIGVSKRTLERYESLSAPKAPKARALTRILETTGRPIDFFFAAPAVQARPTPAVGLEQALTAAITPVIAPVIQEHVLELLQPLMEQVAELERQQAAEGWGRNGRRDLTTTRRAA